MPDTSPPLTGHTVLMLGHVIILDDVAFSVGADTLSPQPFDACAILKIKFNQSTQHGARD